MIRFSSTLIPKSDEVPYENFNPAMGLKLLRDGVPSANILAMGSANGQDNWNFFYHNFSTHIGVFLEAAERIEIKFAEATNYT